MTKDRSLFNYRGDIGRILLYGALSKAVFAVILFVYRRITGLLLWNLDRPAFTSGDLPYLMRSWQGWLLIACGFLALVVYTVFDINAAILISDRVLHGKKLELLPMLRQAFSSLKNFRSIEGILVILYVSLIVPVVGGTFGISLTSDFFIPEFITSVINDSFSLKWLYRGFLAALRIVGFLYLFTFHYAILEDQKLRQGMKNSRLLMKAHWKDFLVRYGRFLLRSVLVAALLAGVLYVIPDIIISCLPLSEYGYHVGVVSVTYLLSLTVSIYKLLFVYFSMMKLTVIFYSYVRNGYTDYVVPAKRRHWGLFGASAAVIAGVFAISLLTSMEFDGFYPAIGDAYVIAHRGGGTLANENTVLSLEAAVSANAAASEIDVQRTADGHYIINHDATFARCCGDNRKPGEMTLEEIKQLGVRDAQNPLAPETEVATIEEMMDAAKGRIELYIELKGESADEQMADDLIAMAKERQMLDECKFISLSYGLIDYIETNYPEAETGYLCYFSFGDLADMNCDVLLLEAETATQENVNRIHAAGKEVNVWTVNTMNAMTHFMASDVDGIITDEVSLADFVRKLLLERSDEARVLQRILQM